MSDIISRISLAIDSTQVKSATDQVEKLQKAGQGAEKTTASLGKSMLALGAGLLTIQAVSAAFMAALKSSANFETALIGVAKTTGMAGDELATFGKSIDNISKKLPVSTAELLELAQVAGQMGVTGSENLEKFALTVAKLGRASNLSGEEAASSLARILNVTGEAVGSIDVLASVIVALGNSTAATESEIAHSATEVARASAVFGVTSAEASALAAAMSSIGIQAQIGGSSVGRAMQEIVTRTSQGGDSLREFADALGLNANELARLAQNDKLAAFEMFLRAVGGLGDQAGAALEQVGLGGQEIMKTIVPLANNMRIFTDTMAIANREVRNATALDREFEATLKSLDSQWIITKNIVESYARVVMDALLPAFNAVLVALNSGALQNIFKSIIAVGTTAHGILFALATAIDGVAKQFVALANFDFSKVLKIGSDYFSVIDKSAKEHASFIKNLVDGDRAIESASSSSAASITKESVALDKSNLATKTATVAKTALVKVQKEQISDSERFLSALEKEASLVGKSAIEVRKIEAANLGVSGSADVLIDKIDAETRAFNAMNEQMSRGQSITQSMMTGEEQLAATQVELNSLLEAGAISVETYDRALLKAQGGLEKTEKVAKQSFADIDQYAIQASRNIQTSMANFLFDPFQDGLKGMITGMIDAVRRMVAEIAAVKIAQSVGLTGIFAGATGAAGAATGTATTGTSANLLNIASLSGSITSALSAGFSTGFGVTSLLSKTATTLGTTFGSAALTSFGVGLGGGTAAAAAAGDAAFLAAGGTGTAAAVTGGVSAASMGAAFAAVAGPAIALLAVDQIGRFIAGNKTTGTIASAIPVIGGFIDALFGHGPLKQKETNLTGVASSGGFDGNTSTKFKSEGGALTSDKTYRIIIDTQTGEILSSFTSKLNSFAHASQEGSMALGEFLSGSFSGISAAFKSVGTDLGLATEGIDNFSMGVSIASEKGKSLTDEQIGKVITDFSDALAQKLIPNINLFIKDGETAAGAVARIGAEFNGLVGATSILGVSLADATARMQDTTIQGRTAFVEAAGGMDALNSKTSYFAQNFLDGSEILARSTEILNNQLSSLGLSADLTKDQFKDLVQSFGRVGGVSEDMLIALLDIAPIFNEVRTETERLNPALAETVEVVAELTEAVILSKDTIYQSVKSLTEVGYDLSDALAIVQNNAPEAIQGFIDAHGGLEAIAATTKEYAEGYMSSAEQMAAKTEYLGRLLENIGLSANFSVQNVRELILGLGEYTNATDDQKIAFMGILKLFDEVHGTLNDVVPAVEEVINVIDDLGDISASASFGMQSLVNSALNLGLTMQQASALISGYSAEALNAFIAAAGGMAQLTSQTEFFKQNFLTAEQAFSADAQSLSNALGALGISSSITRAEFTAMVQSFGQGSAMFNSLMNIMPLFDSVFDQIEAANAAAAAYVPPEPVLLNGAEIQAAQQALSEAEQQLAQAHNDLASAYNAEAQSLQEVSDKFHGLAANLRAASDALALGQLSPLTPMEQYEEALKQVNATAAAAMSGDADALAALPGAVDAFLSASQVINASGAAYTSDFQWAQELLDAAASGAEAIASDADRQLSALQAQYGELVEINDGVASVAVAVNNLAIAQAAFNAAQAAIPAEVYSNPANNPPATLGNLPPPAPMPTPTPSNVLPFPSDQQIMDFVNQANGDWMSVYDAAIQYGVSSQRLSDVAGIPMSAIEQWVKDNNVAMFEKGARNVKSTGLAMIHKGENVTPAGGDNGMIIELQAVRAELAQMRGDQMRASIAMTNEIVKSNDKNADKINDNVNRVEWKKTAGKI